MRWSSLLLLLAATGCGGQAPEHQIVTASGGEVRIPLDAVDDGGVHFFTFKHDGRNVNFLIRSDADGRLHSHLDACYSCFQYRRGFVVEERALVCRACRLAFPLAEDRWQLIGACAPIEFQSRRAGDCLTLDLRRLERAGRYF